MEHELRFDIFCGTIDKDARWIEAVRGLANARKQMEVLAKENPGKYFVFSTLSHTVLAMTDTTEAPPRDKRPILSDVADFDVVKGLLHGKPLCIGTVRGVQRAIELMYRMYAKIPGDYFVRQKATGKVVASIQRDCLYPKLSGPPLDVFRGVPDGDAVWVEAVDGLASAKERMEQLTGNAPDSYFIFNRRDHTILAFASTASPESSRKSGSAA